jgi:uncharacterized protein YndB with AHSA1/START domain
VDPATHQGDYQTIVTINASPEAVFDALTTTKGISGWWGEAKGDATTGELVVRFGERRKFIHVDEAARPSTVRWTVRKSEPSPEWKGTTITFELTPEGDDQTQLRFRHHGLTPDLDCYGDCSAAWPMVLGNLVNYVEAGTENPYTTDAAATPPVADYHATINVAAAPDRVFDALTSPAAISNWWVTASGGGTAGDELIIHFGDTRAIFHVAEAERASRVRWAVLNCEIEHDGDGTKIIFDLGPAPDGSTRVDFRHAGLTPQLECFEDCRSGWTQALGGLLNYVENGH